MNVDSLAEGQIFASRYRVVQCIASGGMGSVYEVQHTETDRRCALKLMLPSLVCDTGLRDRFKREARVTAQISSEFIVDVLDAGVDEETEAPFIVMEYLDGCDLAHVVAEKGRISPQDAVTYLYQTALALQKTHAANIVHRDLKPENLFLTQRDDGSPRVKILDFGISKVMEANTQGNSTKTLGTPLYMAPEQFRGKVSPATDIYALGMIAFALIVGKSYWTPVQDEEESVWALAGRIASGLPESASSRAAKFGFAMEPAFDGWFEKAVALEPSSRFQSAKEAVIALAGVFGVTVPAAGGQSQPSVPPPGTHFASVTPPIAATSMTAASDASTQPRSSRTGLMLGIGGAMVAIAFGGFALTRMNADTSSTSQPASVVESVVVATAAAPVASPAPSAAASTDVSPILPAASAAPSASAPAATGTSRTPAPSTREPKPKSGGSKATSTGGDNSPYGRY